MYNYLVSTKIWTSIKNYGIYLLSRDSAGLRWPPVPKVWKAAPRLTQQSVTKFLLMKHLAILI